MTEEKAPTSSTPKRKLVQVPDNIRVRAHWYEGILTLLLLLSIVTHYTATDSYTIPQPLFAVSLTTHSYILWITGVTAAIGFFCLLVSGASPSMWLHYVRWVSPESLKPEPLANTVKWLLLMALSTISVGCLPLLLLILTKDEHGRTVLDRGCETWCVYEVATSGTRKVATDEKNGTDQQSADDQPASTVTTEDTEDPNPRAAFYPVADEMRDEETGDGTQTDDTPDAEESAANAEHPIEEANSTLDHNDEAAPAEEDEESLENKVEHPQTQHADEQQGYNPIALIFDDGTHWDLVCPLVVGRDPEVFKRCEDAALLAIDDEARSVSKTHLLVELKDGKVYVEDLQSTNGVKLIFADQREEKLLPHSAVVVEPGTQVVFGQRHFLVKA